MLTSQQRAALRGRAHALNPVVMIGNHGLTAAVQNEIEQALQAHELIKIRVNADNREARTTMITAICAEREAELVQVIGHIAVVYRKRKESKE